MITLENFEKEKGLSIDEEPSEKWKKLTSSTVGKKNVRMVFPSEKAGGRLREKRAKEGAIELKRRKRRTEIMGLFKFCVGLLVGTRKELSLGS